MRKDTENDHDRLKSTQDKEVTLVREQSKKMFGT